MPSGREPSLPAILMALVVCLHGASRAADEGTLLFSSLREDNSSELPTLDLTTRDIRRLMFNAGADVDPAWSPDGRKIAFSSDRDDDKKIYVSNADGSQPTRLTETPGWDWIPQWSPDGRQLAFTSLLRGFAAIQVGEVLTVYVMNADGTGRRKLTGDETHDPVSTWSPDGSTIAFTSYRDGVEDVYTIPSGGGETHRVTEGFRARHVTWSPNGRHFAVVKDDGVGNTDLYVLDTQGVVRNRLTDHPSLDGRPAWSANGDRLVFNSGRDGASNPYIVGRDGQGLERITDHPQHDFSPSWHDPKARAVNPVGMAGVSWAWLKSWAPR